MGDGAIRESGVDQEKLGQTYDRYRAVVEHEDNLVGARVNWFLTASTFLFAIPVRDYVAEQANAGASMSWYIVGCSVLGLALSILTWKGVSAAERAIAEQAERYREALRRLGACECECKRDRDPSMPLLLGPESTHRKGKLITKMVVFLVGASWLCVLVVTLYSYSYC